LIGIGVALHMMAKFPKDRWLALEKELGSISGGRQNLRQDSFGRLCATQGVASRAGAWPFPAIPGGRSRRLAIALRRQTSKAVTGEWRQRCPHAVMLDPMQFVVISFPQPRREKVYGIFFFDSWRINMALERRDAIRQLFSEALHVPVSDRLAFLAEQCRSDAELLRAVESLLADPSTQLISTPGSPLRRETDTQLKDSENLSLAAHPRQRIGPYDLVREIGQGGMGSVYMAVRTDGVHHQTVALKMVRPEAGRIDVIERFRQEREILASLDHPNIARLWDGGTTPEGLPYFVMDYVAGQPIDEYCDAQCLTVEARLKLFQDVCSAVEYAHGRGIVHRDIKPSNILVNDQGQVKLLDFGIAKLIRPEPDSVTGCLTRTGMLLMTPQYASPEQVKGEKVGFASDIYSLGTVLYELLTGHRPYRLRSRLAHEIVRVVCEEDPIRPSRAVSQTEERSSGAGNFVPVNPQIVSRARGTTPRDLQRNLMSGLDNVVLKAMRKEPAKRYKSAGELREDLRRYLDGLPVSVRATRWSYDMAKLLRRHKWWTAATIAVLAGIATGVVRINPIAAAAAVLLLITVSVRYLVMRSEYGQPRASGRLFNSGLSVIFQAAVFYLVLFAALSNSKLALLIFIGAGVRFTQLLAQWTRRERWAGPLLLDASRPKPRLLWIWFLLMVVLVTLMGPILFFGGLPIPWVASILFALASFAVNRFWTFGHVEVRAKGIIAQFGVLLRWHKIRSYAWESSDVGVAVLRVQLGRFSRGPRFPIPVASHAKDALTAILDQRLAEWPTEEGRRNVQFWVGPKNDDGTVSSWEIGTTSPERPPERKRKDGFRQTR
jgi:serine/threonine protein kinase